MNESKQIKIILKKDPIFRQKHEAGIEIPETTFSEEENNLKNLSGEMGWKLFSLNNKSNGERIGTIYYDYPKEKSIDPVLRIRVSALEDKYKGKNLGIKLYEKLLEKARDKKLAGIGSDASVAGGAIVIWKKLMDKGYKLTIYPSMEEKWKLFLKTYDEGKVFKEKLNVDDKGSVFKILLKDQKDNIEK